MPASGIPTDPGKRKRIGEILLEKGKISEEQLREALAIQEEKGGRLGWLLLSLGYISRLDLFTALAEHFSLDFVLYSSELVHSMDKHLVSRLSMDEAIRHHVLPISLAGDRLRVLTDFPLYPGSREFCHRRFGAGEIEYILVTDLDFMKLVQDFYGQKIIDLAVNGLFFRNPQESAYSVFTKTQVCFMALFFYAGLAWLYLDPTSFLVATFAISQFMFFIFVCYKLVLSLVGARYERYHFITDDEVSALNDRKLPLYTILVPVYREPEVIHILVDSIRNLDYPQDKLDVLLLLEEDDEATLEAAKRVAPPGNWRFIRIPNAPPKTKPKACNYGVFFSKGKFITIYDAEDIPEPDQLKKAVIGFKKYGKSYVCLQAALNYFNSNENIIARLFTLEYSYWFDYLLPGLDVLHLPIPLGGTSNHFRADALRELGAWDPYNVTEDADLGIRACANGYNVGIINSTTLEEANSRYGNWIRQRSRWIKGYMQTFLVYNRHPVRMLRKIGLANWLSFQLFIGGTPLIFLITPMAWGVFICWLLTRTTALDPFFPPLVLYIGLFNLLIGNFMGIYLNMIAVYKREKFSLLPAAILNPVYWLLGHSVAAYKALAQLFTRPFYWEKTEHGITKLS